MELHDDLHFAIGNGMKARRREQRGKLSFVRGRIKKFLDDGRFEDWRRGTRTFLREMKWVLYTADEERFREKVFIGRSSEIRWLSLAYDTLQEFYPIRRSISFYL